MICDNLAYSNLITKTKGVIFPLAFLCYSVFIMMLALYILGPLVVIAGTVLFLMVKAQEAETDEH